MSKVVAVHSVGNLIAYDPQGLAQASEVNTRKMVFLVGAGIVGGIFFGRLFVQEFFVEGLTDETRRNILKASAVFLAAWGAKELFQLDKEWWFTPEGAAEKAQSELAP